MMARQKEVKKRSLHGVNEHFEPLFNAASAALGINQSFLKFLLALLFGVYTLNQIPARQIVSLV